MKTTYTIESPLVFRVEGRIFWLQFGRLWTFSRRLFKWWPVRVVGAPQISGQVLTETERAALVAELGSPLRPRVDAGGHCLTCQHLTEEPRIYFGRRGPFCGRGCFEAWLATQPVVDRRSTEPVQDTEEAEG